MELKQPLLFRQCVRKELVVAKYKEDLSWLDSVPDSWTVTCYSKDPAEKNTQYLKLPNVGREADTYLHYIIENYAALPDLLVFAQGNPFDHCPDFLAKLENLEVPCRYQALSDIEAIFDSVGFPQLAASSHDLRGRTFADFFFEILQYSVPTLIYARMNSLFAVDRATVLLRPIEFYKRCLAQLRGHNDQEYKARIGINCLEGHYFERLWPFIFSTEVENTSGVANMPNERFQLVASLVARWPSEFQNKGHSAASCVLLAASEILSQSR